MHKRHVSTITALSLAASLLAACGGGGGSSAAPPVPVTPAKAGTAPMKLTLSIPGKASSTAVKSRRYSAAPANATRNVSYSSRSVRAVDIDVMAHGAFFPVLTAAPSYATNLSPLLNNNNTTCTAASPADGSYSCTILIVAPVGFDDIRISEWDAANATPGATPAAPAGNVLAIGTTFDNYAGGFAVEQNQTNAPVIPLHGVVNSATISETVTSMVSGTGSNTTLGVTALDADANVITGDQSYVDTADRSVTLKISGATSGYAPASDFAPGLTFDYVDPSQTHVVSYRPVSGLSISSVAWALSVDNVTPGTVAGTLHGATLSFTQTNGSTSVPGAPLASYINPGGGWCLKNNHPSNVIQGADGKIYVNDDGNGGPFGSGAGVIDQIDTATGNCSYAQEGTSVTWIAAGADGDIWYADAMNAVVGKFSPSAFNAASTASPNCCANTFISKRTAVIPFAVGATFGGLIAGADGKMYATDTGGNVDIVNPQTMAVTQVAVSGQKPYGIAKGPILANGHQSVVWADQSVNSIAWMDLSDRSVHTLGVGFGALPTRLVTASNGLVYVGTNQPTIKVVDINAASVVQTFWPNGTPQDLTIGPDGNVYAAETGGLISRITIPASGGSAILTEFGSNTGLNACNIMSLAPGPDNNLYGDDGTCGDAFKLSLP